MRGVILYATRYGSTKTVCQWIRQGMAHSEASIHRITQWRGDADFFILGCPIFIGKPHPDMTDFLHTSKQLLQGKPVAMFITSWAESTPYRASCRDFLALLRFHLSPCAPIAEASLPGRLLMEEISPIDRRVMGRLLRRIDDLSPDFHSKNMGWKDARDKEQCMAFGRRLDRILSALGTQGSVDGKQGESGQ